MENKTIRVSGGLTFTSLLQLVFIVLKLCNVINWSWWLVLLPLWINLGIIALVFIIAFIVAMLG